MKTGFSSGGFGIIGGPVILLTSLLLLLTGFIRGELASLLWGGSLLFLLLFCFFVVVLTGLLNRRIGKASDSSSTLPLDGEQTLPGVVLTGEAMLPFPIRSFPGVSVSYNLDYRFRTREFHLSGSLKSGSVKAGVAGKPVYRGKYRGVASIVIRDLPGFFSAVIPLQGMGLLTVFPYGSEIRNGEHFPSFGGKVTPEVRRKQESQELFDWRKFYPGDDPRKLNWKLYAHSGELFMRKGEPEPPPAGNYQIVLDLCLSNAPAQDRHDIMEYMLSRGAGFFCGLLERGKSLNLLVPGEESVSFSAGEEKALLSFLSGLWLSSDQNEKAGSDGLSAERGIYIYSSPFSSRFTLLLERLRKKGGTGGVKILVPAVPDPDECRADNRRSILFLKGSDKVLNNPENSGKLRISLAREWEDGLGRISSGTGKGLHEL